MPGNEAKLTDRSSEVRGLGYDHAAIENEVSIDYCITGCINSRVLCRMKLAGEMVLLSAAATLLLLANSVYCLGTVT